MKKKTTLPTKPRSARRRFQQRPPPLRLTPYAWAKLVYLRDLGETEVGGFGISRLGELLLVEDVQLVRQECSAVTVKFHDESVADYFDTQVDRGRRPEQFARIWIHTHPGDSPYPSCTDEETFQRCFGSAEWAVMLIVARGGQSYARLQLNTGPGGALVLLVDVDFQEPFPGADSQAWETEYRDMVSVEPERPRMARAMAPDDSFLTTWLDDERVRYRDAWLESFSPDSYSDIPLELIDVPAR